MKEIEIWNVGRNWSEEQCGKVEKCQSRIAGE